MISQSSKISFYSALLNSILLHTIPTVIDLSLYEKRLISPNGEDGILEEIFSLIGTTNSYYVELGAGSGHYGSKTKYFKEKYCWNGLLLDLVFSEKGINLHKTPITAENVVNLLRQYNIPEKFDLLCINIKGNDFYIWQALAQRYKPRVLVITFNKNFRWDEDKVVKYDAAYRWDGTKYSGASMLALFNLGRILGYSLVYQESNGYNLFFIRDDVLIENKISFKNMNDVMQLYTASAEALENFDDMQLVSSEQLLVRQ